MLSQWRGRLYLNHVMKLTRHELIHATDAQLRTIDLHRKNNSGWLQFGLSLDLPEERIAVFHKADTRKKIDPEDKNVESVRSKLLARMKTGFRKYGVTTERDDLTRKDWLRHAQEEAMDLCIYLERLIQDEP